jgi:2-dehydro-3-deoxyphosphogluconate aldolase/(4S)-4-hydroxy-2-oxoglutarate aldolase
MEKKEVVHRMYAEGVIPVVRVANAAEAMETADALKKGGLSLIEITMTVEGALDVMKELARKYRDEIILGAGTILDAETGRQALLAGAKFVVSPVLDLELIKLCRRYGATVMPGAMTPTEILAAWSAGADLVKVFPCGQLGGAEYLKAVKGPLPQVQLVPTGGVNLQNAAAFIKAGAAALGVGGELVDKKAVAAKNFAVIEENARAYLAAVKAARGK